MFKHILLPTDGSDLSKKAVLHGLQLAHLLGARVTACHAAGHNDLTALYVTSGAITAEVGNEIEERFRERVKDILQFVSEAAQSAGVICQTKYVNETEPYLAIIEMAEKEGCDLICMASHGRHGVSAILLGSETAKVLAHSKIPVLVYR